MSVPPFVQFSGSGSEASPELLMVRFASETTQAIILYEAGQARTLVKHTNEAFKNLTGFGDGEARGKTLSELLCPPWAHREWDDLERALAGNRTWHKVLPAVRKDCSAFQADVHLYPIRQDATVTHWVSVIKEVADVSKPGRNLRRHDSQYQLLAENIRDLIVVLSPEGRCRYVSPSSNTMLGYTPDELLGKPLYYALPPEDRAAARQLLARHREGPTESCLTHRIRRKNGTFLWAETISKSYRSATDDTLIEIVAVTRDITKRRAAQENLSTAHSLLETIYRTVPIGLCLIDSSGSIAQCNDAFAQAFDCPAEAFIGRPIDSLIPTETLGRASVTQQRPIECDCTDAHGAPFPAEITLVAFKPNGIAKQLLTLTNLRERKRIELRLREINQLESLATLAAGVAHDFNNKLAIIIAYASLLHEAAGDPVRVAHYADTISEAGQRGADVVRQLQLFASTHEAEVAPVDLHELLEQVLHETCASWPAALEIRRNFAAANAVFTADSFQLAQAVSKLLEHAKEAMPKGGTLTVSTAELRQAVFGPTGLGAQKNFLRISIEDTGIGMDDATRARLFEPFFSRGKGPESVRVGMAVVYGIMRAHHGSIEVDSSPGKGTRINLLFPRADTEAHPDAQLPFETFDTPLDKKTILVVEDEQGIGGIWQEVLPHSGWRVLWAHDGHEALQLYRAHRDEIALVFTDIGLPGIDGWEVATTIRSEQPNLPLLFTSGAFRLGDRDRGYAEPVAYLAKPYAIVEVLALIQTLVPA